MKFWTHLQQIIMFGKSPLEFVSRLPSDRRSEFILGNRRVVYVPELDDAMELLKGPIGLKKLHNPLLNRALGPLTVLTSVDDPLHHDLHRAVSRALYPLIPDEERIVAEVTKGYLQEGQGKRVNVQEIAHTIAFQVAVSVFFAPDVTATDDLERIGKSLRGFQANVPLGLIVLSRLLLPGFVSALARLTPWNAATRYRFAIKTAFQKDIANPRNPRLQRLAYEVEQLQIPSLRREDQYGAILLVALETFACTLAWMFYRLAQHPDEQEQLRRADIAEREAWIGELLRLYPPHRFLMRFDRDGKRVYVMNVVALNATQRPENPNAFCPDDIQQRPSRVMTFGYGHRRCSGEIIARRELMIALDTVLASVSPVMEQDAEPEESNLLRPGKAIVRFEHRGKNV